MTSQAHQKVTASHLKREAYLYIRQSTVRQVFENTESTRRQYALRDRAVAMGWPHDRVIVIDSDQGRSGASSADREGFQKLVVEVGMGNAGIVLGLEVSRLARNSSDWHRLLEICALSDTLILDEDGLYNPSDFNDRLLLGLKGTMSEAELHVLRARLRGGILNQARRGALKMPLPLGFIHDPGGSVVLDPDAQVQKSLHLLFETYQRTGSASATVKYFRRERLLFPRRPKKGEHKGELLWEPLHHWRVLTVLHNPRYAGAFAFGRTRSRKRADGVSQVKQAREDWISLIPDAHPGYISWEQYEVNQQRLLENAQAHGSERHKSPPREGPALLQGAVICGVCGLRMTVRYHIRQSRMVPQYVCQRKGIETATTICQSIPGAGIDEVIGQILMETVTPVTLEVAMQVKAELENRTAQADELRRQHVERARQEADMARRRYMEVDPGNRLVADVLEAEWNGKLRRLHEAQETYEKQRAQERTPLNEEQRRQILQLATDFPRLWQDPKTLDRERKRMVRLLIEDVTLRQSSQITVDIRFRGGTLRREVLPPPLSAWQQRQTDPAVIAEIDRLLDHHTEEQVAQILNERGFDPGMGGKFNVRIIQRLCRAYSLKKPFDRLRATGMLTLTEIAERLDVSTQTVKIWQRKGLIRAHAYNSKEFLYEYPDDDPPVKMQGRKLSERRRFPQVETNRTEEVQCDT